MFLVQVQNFGFAANNIGHCEIVIQAMCNAAINIFSFIKVVSVFDRSKAESQKKTDS